jgi:hypothetical protein
MRNHPSFIIASHTCLELYYIMIPCIMNVTVWEVLIDFIHYIGINVPIHVLFCYALNKSSNLIGYIEVTSLLYTSSIIISLQIYCGHVCYNLI